MQAQLNNESGRRRLLFSLRWFTVRWFYLESTVSWPKWKQNEESLFSPQHYESFRSFRFNQKWTRMRCFQKNKTSKHIGSYTTPSNSLYYTLPHVLYINPYKMVVHSYIFTNVNLCYKNDSKDTTLTYICTYSFKFLHLWFYAWRYWHMWSTRAQQPINQILEFMSMPHF